MDGPRVVVGFLGRTGLHSQFSIRIVEDDDESVTFGQVEQPRPAFRVKGRPGRIVEVGGVSSKGDATECAWITSITDTNANRRDFTWEPFPNR